MSTLPARPSDAPALAAGASERIDTIVEERSRWGWIGYAVLGVLVAMFINNLLTNDNWHWGVVREYLFNPQVLKGLANTILLTALAGVTGVLFGLVVALMRLSSNRLLRGVATAYVGLIRAIPGLVLLLLIYFVSAIVPTVSLGVPFGPSFFDVPVNAILTQLVAAWIGLTLIMGAHCGEIFRGGVLSVPNGQVEAAKALAMSPWLTMRRVVLPQAIRVTIPALANELISLFKNTSLVSVIGFAELLTVVQLIYGQNYQTIPLLVVACLWYLLLTTLAMMGQKRLEQRYSKGHNLRT